MLHYTSVSEVEIHIGEDPATHQSVASLMILSFFLARCELYFLGKTNHSPVAFPLFARH
jgi:hypothetical protein